MRTIWFLLVATLTACGESIPPATESDAAPPIDAAQQDAVGCSLVSVPLPTSDPAPQVVFDIPLGTDVPIAVTMAPGGSEVVVASLRGIHRLSLAGEVVWTTPMTVPGSTDVLVFAFAADLTGYGASISISGGASAGRRFCIVDPAGALEVARCISLEGESGRLISDGTSYHFYGERDGAMRRVTYDTTPTFVGIEDLSLPNVVANSVVAAAVSSGIQYVVAYDYLAGAECNRAREHVIDDGAHGAREVFPADAGGHREVPVIGVDGAGGASIVSRAACTVGACDTAPEATSLLTTYQAGTLMLDRVSLPAMPGSLISAVLRDAGRTVVIEHYTRCEEEIPRSGCFRCTQHAVLSRFGADGTTEKFGIEIAIDFDGFGLEVAAAVAGPGDYVFAYRLGMELRVARVLVP